jgi:hypothetical protein
MKPAGYVCPDQRDRALKTAKKSENEYQKDKNQPN